jgi:signal transduction histidine kinase
VRSRLAKLRSPYSPQCGGPDAPFTGSPSFIQSCQSPSSPREDLAPSFSESLPCVMYECNGSLELTYVSENVSELLGLEASQLIGRPLLSEERLPTEDLIRLSNRLREVERLDSMLSLIHRVLDKRGLPLWIVHNLWKTTSNNTTSFRGHIVPIECDVRLNSTEQTLISRFVHKIGNHFQLLNLVINSLKRTIRESKETEMLQETVEKAIELTRSFSDYNQDPTCFSEVVLMDVLEGAAMTRGSLFGTKGITFDTQIDPSVSGATLQGDPYLLDLAIGHLLQNALESTNAGGRVILQASVKRANDVAPVARISIKDSGCGIEQNVLSNVIVPFFSSKKNHDGLGLSMASRFIDIHGGILRITSVEGKGTDVDIVLPINLETQTVLL